MHQPPISLQISSASCWKLSNILGPCTTAFYPIYQPSAILYQVNDYLTHNKGLWHLWGCYGMASNDNRGKTREITRRYTVSFAALASCLPQKRYNIQDKYYGIIKPITLPSSKAYVRMVCNDASACLQSIMTDPRLDKADYLLGPRQSICTRITWTTLVTLIQLSYKDT
jgi:hypothetical protein